MQWQKELMRFDIELFALLFRDKDAFQPQLLTEKPLFRNRLKTLRYRDTFISETGMYPSAETSLP